MNSKKSLLKYMIPGIIGLLFNSLYIIVDGIFVSKILGSDALAAVTLVVPIVEFIIALSLMISIGGGVYISLNKGRDNIKESRNYFNQGFKLIFIISIAITSIILLFRKPLIGWLGASEELYSLTSEYLLWFTVFIPFFMMNYALGTWIRNDGKPQLAMITQVLSAVTNVILDYVLMKPLNLGIKGAAIATGLGPVLGIILLLPHFLRKKGDLYFESSRINLDNAKEIVFAGLPSFTIEFSLGVTTFLSNIFIVKVFHETGIATFGVIGYINLIVLSIFLGIGQGTQPIISELEGEHKYEEINEISSFLLKISTLIGIVSYLVLISLKQYIIPIFIDMSDIALYDMTYRAINFFFVTLAITGINVTISSIFEARRKVVPSITISILRSFIFLLPSLFVLSLYSKGQFIWLAVPFAEVFTLLIAIYLFQKHKAKV